MIYEESIIQSTQQLQQQQNDWMQRYIDPTQNTEYQEAKKKREQAALPRNKVGEILYSQDCAFCTEHYEVVDTCDLCGTVWPYERLHKSIGKKSDWVDSLFHDCQYAKKYLQLLLKAVI